MAGLPRTQAALVIRQTPLLSYRMHPVFFYSPKLGMVCLAYFGGLSSLKAVEHMGKNYKEGSSCLPPLFKQAPSSCGMCPPHLGLSQAKEEFVMSSPGLKTELEQDTKTNVQRSRTKPKEADRVAGIPLDKEKRLWEGCCASCHLSLSIAIGIYPLIPTLGCSKHLDIEEGRMHWCNAGKLDTQEKSEKLLMLWWTSAPF